MTYSSWIIFKNLFCHYFFNVSSIFIISAIWSELLLTFWSLCLLLHSNYISILWIILILMSLFFQTWAMWGFFHNYFTIIWIRFLIEIIIIFKGRWRLKWFSLSVILPIRTYKNLVRLAVVVTLCVFNPFLFIILNLIICLFLAFQNLFIILNLNISNDICSLMNRWTIIIIIKDAVD